MPSTFLDPELERLIELRDKDPDRFEELADLSKLVALKSYEDQRAAGTDHPDADRVVSAMGRLADGDAS